MEHLSAVRLAWTMAAAFLVFPLAGCRVFPEWETVELSLPNLPAAWSACGLDPVWEVQASWTGGQASAAILPDGTATLCLPREEVSAVLAYPSSAGLRLRPAGAVLPLASVSGGRVNLTWKGGYQAEAARALIRAGMDPALFDLDRFLSEAFARLDDPWKTPPDTFSAAFAEGSFRVTWLDPPPEYPTAVEGLPGPAASESPFGVSLAPDGEGRAEAELSQGVSRWHAAWGRVSVELREDGSATWSVVR